jgi:hypothetical protein
MMKKRSLGIAVGLILCAGLSTGCATKEGNTDVSALQDIDTAAYKTGGIAGAAKSWKPEYAMAIDKVTDMLVGKRVNPVAGFKLERSFTVKNEPIQASDLKMREIYYRDYGVEGVRFVTLPDGSVSTNSAPVVTGVAPGEVDVDPEYRAQVRAEVEALMQAIEGGAK